MGAMPFQQTLACSRQNNESTTNHTICFFMIA